jgi:hypothetical protein
MYNKTHGLSEPGEQKKRYYKWNFDKDNHVFGKYEPIERDGTKKSLRNDYLEADYPKTRIVDKRLEDFRQATTDMVGKIKFKGSLNPNLDADHTYGVKTIIGENWNVARCIHGDPEEKNEKHFTSDSDLGKSVLHRSKLQYLIPNVPPSDKVFGVPSIRADLKKNPKQKLLDVKV